MEMSNGEESDQPAIRKRHSADLGCARRVEFGGAADGEGDVKDENDGATKSDPLLQPPKRSLIAFQPVFSTQEERVQVKGREVLLAIATFLFLSVSVGLTMNLTTLYHKQVTKPDVLSTGIRFSPVTGKCCECETVPVFSAGEGATASLGGGGKWLVKICRVQCFSEGI